MVDLYIKYNGKIPVAYAFGEPWVAQALLMDDIKYSTKEEAIKAWYKDLIRNDPKKEITENEKDIIYAIAEADLNVTKAAANMHNHRNTFIYHRDKIKEKTGLDPKKFYDMQNLLIIIEGNYDQN